MFATRRKEAKAVDRVILHIDMNNFYASVETLYDPSLKDIPMAVGGDKERRHGIVLAKNMLAKAKGVKTAEALWEAERKCPGIKFVPPHFERYAKYSRLAKEIYMQYTDMVESFGLDECWLDVTGSRRCRIKPEKSPAPPFQGWRGAFFSRFNSGCSMWTSG